MDIVALVFLIAGKIASIKGLMTASIVLSSVCLVLNLLLSVINDKITNDKDAVRRVTVGVFIDAILLTLSIIFRVGM